ncbi:MULTISPECIES: DEAD/DEAH box helicase [unclassified Dyella]|uniref:DEAD/DEAH box helicase n=1 Tax=unclassified Dyella TaxID=2634549 RepID=UPI000C844039|nr:MULTISPECIES: DEAD/DEAH box helicase [unclassified Dyella]MDR3444538.1 DEAD/DEAH box helicase [Dyella sp.]PMQ05596.1 ATP-dependent RNA helicase DeaD [Dyella sp. AD56]
MSSPSSDSQPAAVGFAALGLHPELLRALTDVGYESPSPIQAATIPPLLEGRDVLGQAQTGTGKTAAFALPILSRIDLKPGKPQALVLAPTRELAIQVAEAFQRYATHMPGLQVLPIYGGQSYGPQLHSLKRGVQIVVGTPGRVIDHLERGTLDLSELKFLVLDEADEMLRMGFIDDVEKVLQATPPERQVALFSATMPSQIRKIAQQHLKDPREVTIKSSTTTAANIRQRYWFVSGMHKLDAMTRILEAEPFDAMIIFARTKSATEELAEKLQARGLAAAAINGDIAQAQRERVIQQLKDGKLDILVATDVAARGLDVERISHVMNYDIPYDTESYVHRIGRTGRAGRSGEAILFVTPREKGMLRAIERATRQPIEEMKLPTVEAVNDVRIAKFKQRISDTIAVGELGLFQQLIEQYEQEHNIPAVEIAAALARIAQGNQPLLLTPPPKREFTPREPGREREHSRDRGDREHRGEREQRPRDRDRDAGPRDFTPRPVRPHHTEEGKSTYRIEVGHEHGVKPGNIIGAIANEAGLESQHIGRLSIRGEYSLIDLPAGMPAEVFQHLQKVWVSQQQLRIREWDGNDSGASEAPPHRPGGGNRPGGFKKPGGKPKPHGYGGNKGPRRGK